MWSKERRFRSTSAKQENDTTDQPDDEKCLCTKRKPILQDGNVRIDRRFKLERRGGAPWNSRNPEHVKQAEERLYKLFADVFEA